MTDRTAATNRITAQYRYDPVASDQASVFFLAGQSNAGGYQLDPTLWPATCPVPVYGAAGISKGASILFQPMGPSYKGTSFPYGPFLPLAKRLYQRWGKKEIILGLTYVNGTDIDQWAQGTTNYNDLRDRINNAKSTLTAYYPRYSSVKIEGLDWWHGETDGGDATKAAAYESKLLDFIANLRADVSEPTMPFCIGRLSDSQTFVTYRSTIQAAQDAVAAASPYNMIVNMNGLTMQADNLHYDEQGCCDGAIRHANALADYAGKP